MRRARTDSQGTFSVAKMSSEAVVVTDSSLSGSSLMCQGVTTYLIDPLMSQ